MLLLVVKGPTTPGRALYERWCGSSESTQALYYDAMNPASKRNWERLAAEVVVREKAEVRAEKAEARAAELETSLLNVIDRRRRRA